VVVLHIEELMPRFPDFRVGVIAAEGLTISEARPPELEHAIRSGENELLQAWGGRELGAIPDVRAWRQTYKAFGVKGTSHRSSVERLLKRVLQGSGLPRVNTLVDTYNCISVRFQMPSGADDLDSVAQPQSFRFARRGDTFTALGEELLDSPERGEVVYADAEKVLCRRWNWKQDARSPITLGTRRAVLTVQAIEPASATRVEEATAALAALVATCCGGKCAWAVADQLHPTVTVPGPSRG
jgi:DNA/RNA-binding domain of Phe-tRNA-synthetase-like protein